MEGMTAPAATTSPWLFGRGIDLLLGAGLGYLLTLPLLLLASDPAGGAGWPILGVVAISLFVSAPHYGATLLRVYEQRADRRRYAFFAYHLTALVALCFAIGVYSVAFGSLLLTLYVSWSPWHIGGQNYGVALLFLRRRGVAVPARAKRLLWASFFLSFVLALLSTHVAESRAVHAAGIVTDPGTYAVMRLGIPPGVAALLAPLLLVAWLGASAGALRLLARGGAARDLAAPASLIASQALWFVVPTFLYFADVDTDRLLPFAAIWISAAHSAQYLWVTTYYAKRTDPGRGAAPYLLRTLLAGLFVTIVPAFLFMPAALGGASWYPGLGALLFAVVNLHHFALDGAVWKLRDGQVARALLRGSEPPTPDTGPGAIAPERPGWLWRLVWIGGALALALTLYERVERRLWLPSITSRADIPAARASLDRLRWIGRDSPRDRLVLANAYASTGDRLNAAGQLRRSIEIHPTPAAWIGLAGLHERASEPEAALEAYRAALVLSPEDPTALSGVAAMERRLERRALPAGARRDRRDAAGARPPP